MVELRRLVPILVVGDLDAEIAFYQALGCAIHYRGDDLPDFAALASGPILFGLERRADFSAPEAGRTLLWQFEVADLSAVARACAEHGYHCSAPFCTWEAGDDWAVEAWSPSGHRVRFEGPRPEGMSRAANRDA